MEERAGYSRTQRRNALSLDSLPKDVTLELSLEGFIYTSRDWKGRAFQMEETHVKV